jgi:hypothetical protein
MIPESNRPGILSRSEGELYVFDDFIGSTLDVASRWEWASGGSGAYSMLSALGGQLQLTTGTTNGSAAQMDWWSESLVGTYGASWRTRAKTSVSGANRTYEISATSEIGGTSWIDIRWNNAVNSAQWIVEYQLRGVVQSTYNSTQALDTASFHVFEMVFRPSNLVDIKYDGTLWTTITAEDNLAFYPLYCVSNASTVAATMQIDWVEVTMERA